MDTTELVKRLRAGLDGVTPGPWKCHTEDRFGGRSQWQEIEIWSDRLNVLIGTEVRRAHLDGGRRTMAHIANCSPENIAALLDTIERLTRERDEARLAQRWNIERDGEHLLICEGDHHRSEPCDFERYVPAARATAAEAERDRLRDALKEVCEAWDWWNIDPYNRCSNVPADAVREARAALKGDTQEDGK